MLKQKVALSADVKAVLDSWARFEQQQKESEQVELTRTVIEKVLANLKDDKTQRDILNASVAEIERKYTAPSIPWLTLRRNGEEQGYLDLLRMS